MSRDGVLVIRHEPEISETTDVLAHPEFADRRRSRTIGGRTLNGFFTCDFTLAELKILRCRERLPTIRPANTRYDGAFQLVTFEEYLDVIAAEHRGRNRRVFHRRPGSRARGRGRARPLSRSPGTVWSLRQA